MYPRELREELNALSKDVFGSSSRWQKLIQDGHPEVVTEEVTEYVPGKDENDPGEERKVQVPVLNPNGTNKMYTKRYTVETIREYMLERKKQLDEIRAQIAKSREEQRAKREAEVQRELLHKELAGSAT